MREFKFRVWDKKRFLDQDEFAISEGKVNQFNMGGWDIRNDVVVQQFTGLVDKNGVEIYEGDLVDGEIWEYRCGYLSGLTPIFKKEVFFHNGVYAVRPYNPLNLVLKAMIVGNIFEKN